MVIQICTEDDDDHNHQFFEITNRVSFYARGMKRNVYRLELLLNVQQKRIGFILVEQTPLCQDCYLSRPTVSSWTVPNVFF